MTATLDSRTFSGPFFQIRREVRTDALDPLWAGWPNGWRDWRYWGPVPAEQFVAAYSGKVVANLASTDGSRVRCRFHLATPSEGMAGGGQGECQLQGDGTIDAVFDHQ